MDLYTFVVEDFIIHDTRSLHSDTLTLSHSAYVDGDLVAQRVLPHMDDFDNGEYSPSDYAPDSGGLENVVMNDPLAKTTFNFQLVNAAHMTGDVLTGNLLAASRELIGFAAGLAGSAAGFSPGGLLLGGLSKAWSWLNADCDGPVAADQLSGPRYVLDAWTDTAATPQIPARTYRVTHRYPGTDSPTGCGGNSDYEVTWSLKRTTTWQPVIDSSGAKLKSDTALSACTHSGAVHAFGVAAGGTVNHASTFTGARWTIDTLPAFPLLDLPVSGVSFDDRLWVFGVLETGSISTLAYSVDGGTWFKRASSPPGLLTAQPIATAVFRDRLYVFATDATTGRLRVTSTADVATWSAWVDVPPNPGGWPPVSAAAATALGDVLHLFLVAEMTIKKPPGVTQTPMVLHNASPDGSTWSGWAEVEGAAAPENYPMPGLQPLDVAATTFADRVYIGSRWINPENNQHLMAFNFSGDGTNWSGWRIPRDDVNPFPDQPLFGAGATAGLAAVNNHLYSFTTQYAVNPQGPSEVWVH